MYGREYFAAREDARRAAMQEREYRRLPVSGGTVLDIGCGTGEFLDAPGWDRYGIEESEYARLEAAERGVKFDLPLGGNWADLVVMRGVLQHLPNPLVTLCKTFAYLKPGGWLAVLATPNTGSLHYRLHKDLPALDPPRNHFVYSAKALRLDLLDIGFKELRFRYPYWGTPYAQPLRDLLRFVTGRQTAFPGNMMEAYAQK